METILDPMTVAPQGAESAGDSVAHVTRASALAEALTAKAQSTLQKLRETLLFLGTDYVQPQGSDPQAGLLALEATLANHPERVEAVIADALRFRFEAMEATFSALYERVVTEVDEAQAYPALTGLVQRLADLGNRAAVNWQNGRREYAVTDLRQALSIAERAYQTQATSGFRGGNGSRSDASRKGVPNPNRKPLKRKGK